MKMPLAFCLLVCLTSCNSQVSHDVPHEANAVFPIREGRVWGAIDQHGRMLVEPGYTDVSHAYGGFFMQTRLIGQEGALLISPDEWLYVHASGGTERINPIIDDFALAVNFGESLFGIFEPSGGWDEHGHIPDAVLDPSKRWNPPDGVLPRDRLSEGLICISQDGRFGYANREGNVIVQPEYDYCAPFVEGLAAVKQGEKWGYINKSGSWVIKPRFSYVGWFDQNIARVVEPGRDRSIFINKSGKELYEWTVPVDRPEQNIFGYSEGLIPHQEPDSELYGFIDAKGEWRIKPAFTGANSFSEGLAAVEYLDQTGLHRGYIDMAGQIRVVSGARVSGGRMLMPFRYGLGGIDGRAKGGYVNHAGEWVWPPE